MIMLAYLGHVWDGVEELEQAQKVGRPLAGGADDVLRSCGRAGVIPSILPTYPGVAIEPSSACSPAARVVDWLARLHVVLVGGAG